MFIHLVWFDLILEARLTADKKEERRILRCWKMAACFPQSSFFFLFFQESHRQVGSAARGGSARRVGFCTAGAAAGAQQQRRLDCESLSSFVKRKTTEVQLLHFIHTPDTWSSFLSLWTNVLCDDIQTRFMFSDLISTFTALTIF